MKTTRRPIVIRSRFIVKSDYALAAIDGILDARIVYVEIMTLNDYRKKWKLQGIVQGILVTFWLFQHKNNDNNMHIRLVSLMLLLTLVEFTKARGFS